MKKLLFFINFIAIFSLQAMTPTEFQGKSLDDFLKGKQVERATDTPVGTAYTYTDGSYMHRYEEGPQNIVSRIEFRTPQGQTLEFDRNGKFVRVIPTEDPIFSAIEQGNKSDVQKLLTERPERANLRNKENQTPLLIALTKAHNLLRGRAIFELSAQEKARLGNFAFIAQLLITQFKSPVDEASITLLRENPKVRSLLSLSPEVTRRMQQ